VTTSSLEGAHVSRHLWSASKVSGSADGNSLCLHGDVLGPQTLRLRRGFQGGAQKRLEHIHNNMLGVLNEFVLWCRGAGGGVHRCVCVSVCACVA
jgi:hypothetical protein